jgi:hypothetical protein
MDPYLEKLKAQLAAAEDRLRKDENMITRYKNEIQRIEYSAGLAKRAATNVQKLGAATTKVAELVAQLPQTKPVPSFGATAMAHTPASAKPKPKPNIELLKSLENIAEGSFGRPSYALTPAEIKELENSGGSRSRRPKPRQAPRRRSARNKKMNRGHSRRSRRHH